LTWPLVALSAEGGERNHLPRFTRKHYRIEPPTKISARIADSLVSLASLTAKKEEAAMRKILFLVVTLALLMTLVGFAFQGRVGNLPPGIDPQMWIPVGPNVGIALEEPRTLPNGGVKGTLMVRLGRDWRPSYLNSDLVPHLEPAQK
jgi:hypothetical protein